MTKPNLRSKRNRSDDAKGNDETDIQSTSNKRKVSSPASEKKKKTNMAKSSTRSSSRTRTTCNESYSGIL
jgi:hypothetical protein